MSEGQTEEFRPTYYLSNATQTIAISRASRLGRVSGDIVIDDRSLSSQHCSFAYKGIRLTITDLGSSNGTYVNGNQLTPHEETILGLGDVIQLGALSFTLTDAPLPDSPPPLPPEVTEWQKIVSVLTFYRIDGGLGFFYGIIYVASLIALGTGLYFMAMIFCPDGGDRQLESEIYGNGLTALFWLSLYALGLLNFFVYRIHVADKGNFPNKLKSTVLVGIMFLAGFYAATVGLKASAVCRYCVARESIVKARTQVQAVEIFETDYWATFTALKETASPELEAFLLKDSEAVKNGIDKKL